MEKITEILCSAALIAITFAFITKAKAVLYKIANRKDDTNVKNHIGN